MDSFSLKTRVKPDGELKLAIPTGLPETDVDVLLVIQPLPAGREGDGTGKSSPDGFFEETLRTPLCVEHSVSRKHLGSYFDLRSRLHSFANLVIPVTEPARGARYAVWDRENKSVL